MRSLAFLLPFTLAGCGGSFPVETTDIATSLDAMYKGTADMSAHYPVGMMTSPSGTCSGTMIGTRTFLTAAHCIHGVYAGTKASISGYVVQFQADFFNNLNHWSPGYNVSTAYVFSTTPSDYDPLDIAVLTLSTDVDTRIGFYNISGDDDRFDNMYVYSYGYGIDPSTGSDGEYRQKIFAVVKTEGGTRDLTGLLELGLAKGSPEVCNGDSGGPVIEPQTGLIAGVNTIASLGDNGKCSGPSFAARTDKVFSSISSQIYRANPPANVAPATTFEWFQKIPAFLMNFTAY